MSQGDLFASDHVTRLMHASSELEATFAALASSPLRADHSPFGEQMSDDLARRHGVPAGSWWFTGDFDGFCGRFSVITNDPALVARFEAAIAANVATPAYASAKADWIRTCLCKSCEPEMRNPSVCRKDL